MTLSLGIPVWNTSNIIGPEGCAVIPFLSGHHGWPGPQGPLKFSPLILCLRQIRGESRNLQLVIREYRCHRFPPGSQEALCPRKTPAAEASSV